MSILFDDMLKAQVRWQKSEKSMYDVLRTSCETEKRQKAISSEQEARGMYETTTARYINSLIYQESEYLLDKDKCFNRVIEEINNE